MDWIVSLSNPFFIIYTMYGFSEHIELSEKAILEYLTQEQIWELAIGYTPKINTYIISPFREDKNPGCFFEYYNGKLFFTDFGAIHKIGNIVPRRINCFNGIQLRFNFNYYECLKYLVDYIKGNKTLVKLNIEYHREIVEKKRPIIEYRSKQFDENHKKYWQKLEISKEQLIEDNIFATKWYKTKYKGITTTYLLNDNEVCYTIGGFEDRVKVCRPYANAKLKWKTNCDSEDIGNYNKIDYQGKQLCIQKSYKDFRVTKNQGVENIIWLQNEVAIPLSKLMSICRTYEETIIMFDNDVTGINNSINLQEELAKNNIKSRAIFIPEHLGCKDNSELLQKHGNKELKKFLYENKVSLASA